MDAELRAEADTLLQHDREAGEFLQPIRERVAKKTLTESCRAEANQNADDAHRWSPPKIRDYEIVAFIGKGGFGEIQAVCGPALPPRADPFGPVWPYCWAGMRNSQQTRLQEHALNW